MKQLLCLPILIALVQTPARAVTCEEGRQVIEQMSKILELSDFEQANIEALITKAKLEEEQGHERNCKIILADAIRFFLIKTVID
jgi:hypothetical protein